MSATFLPASQRPKTAATGSSQIQLLLDENTGLIQTILEYQNRGRGQEALQYQQLLHRNLVYLATIADQTQHPSNATGPQVSGGQPQQQVIGIRQAVIAPTQPGQNFAPAQMIMVNGSGQPVSGQQFSQVQSQQMGNVQTPMSNVQQQAMMPQVSSVQQIGMATSVMQAQAQPGSQQQSLMIGIGQQQQATQSLPPQQQVPIPPDQNPSTGPSQSNPQDQVAQSKQDEQPQVPHQAYQQQQANMPGTPQQQFRRPMSSANQQSYQQAPAQYSQQMGPMNPQNPAQPIQYQQQQPFHYQQQPSQRVRQQMMIPPQQQGAENQQTMPPSSQEQGIPGYFQNYPSHQQPPSGIPQPQGPQAYGMSSVEGVATVSKAGEQQQQINPPQQAGFRPDFPTSSAQPQQF